VPVWAVLPGRAVSFTHTRRDASYLVDVSLHTAREACFTDRTAACGVFIARPTGQTLCQGTHGSGLDTGDMSYTYDQYGTFFGPVFALRTASFANKALLPFRSSLKVAHHVGCLCEMSDGFMLITESAVSTPGDHRSRGIQCRNLNLNPTLRVG
jgi:hypothetical protein